jgi:hypothetical protein
MSALQMVGDWLLVLGCALAVLTQAAVLRSPDVRESELACALRRIKLAAWALLGARLGWLLATDGDLPIGFMALVPMLLLVYADVAWPLLRLMERHSCDPRTSVPGDFDSVPHHHWPGVVGRGKDS